MTYKMPGWAIREPKMFVDIESSEGIGFYVHCVKCSKQILEVDPKNYETPVCEFCRGVKI